MNPIHESAMLAAELIETRDWQRVDSLVFGAALKVTTPKEDALA
jgi:hypothetical protein